MIALNYTELLSEITIDHYYFKITWSPILKNACILWFRDAQASRSFEALGQFSQFDKRAVLDFIVRYSTSAELRVEIDARRFERKVASLPPHFFKSIEKLSVKDKERAYRHLFSLDDEIRPQTLAARRRIMARKFHPDAGGDHHKMTLINQAYDFLSTRAEP